MMWIVLGGIVFGLVLVLSAMSASAADSGTVRDEAPFFWGAGLALISWSIAMAIGYAAVKALL